MTSTMIATFPVGGISRERYLSNHNLLRALAAVELGTGITVVRADQWLCDVTTSSPVAHVAVSQACPSEHRASMLDEIAREVELELSSTLGSLNAARRVVIFGSCKAPLSAHNADGASHESVDGSSSEAMGRHNALEIYLVPSARLEASDMLARVLLDIQVGLLACLTGDARAIVSSPSRGELEPGPGPSWSTSVAFIRERADERQSGVALLERGASTRRFLREWLFDAMRALPQKNSASLAGTSDGGAAVGATRESFILNLNDGALQPPTTPGAPSATEQRQTQLIDLACSLLNGYGRASSSASLLNQTQGRGKDRSAGGILSEDVHRILDAAFECKRSGHDRKFVQLLVCTLVASLRRDHRSGAVAAIDILLQLAARAVGIHWQKQEHTKSAPSPVPRISSLPELRHGWSSLQSQVLTEFATQTGTFDDDATSVAGASAACLALAVCSPEVGPQHLPLCWACYQK